MKFLLPLPLAALAVLLAAPAAGHAQVLLSASEFALLGGTAITVGGPGPNPILNGHVGLSTSATSNITGFPPAVVSGFTVTGAPATIVSTGGQTSQAGLDLITARNALFALPQVPANDLSNLDLGTLAALRPGVYFSSSASTQTGAIILDANFQNGVAWVFNFSLSLTTAANSTVTFINLGTNGGTDNGIYWNAATAVTIGDNNTILGNYLAGTSVSFTGITTVLAHGGARALAGAAVSFAGPAPLGFNTRGGPAGGDFDGGFTYNGSGQLVPSVAPAGPGVPVVPGIPGVPVVPVVPGPIVHTGNVLLSPTGTSTAGPSGNKVEPGTPYPATTVTLDGNHANGAAPASLTINTSTVTLSGTNTYTGGTVVNSGALIAGSANLPANQGVTLNASSLNFNQPADGSFGGVISGTGGVIKSGAGALTVTAPSTYTGGTTISGGTLVATSAALPANRPVALVGGGILALDQASDGTFGGLISGNGTIQKRGAGALTLAQATTAPVTVQAGSLFNTAGLGATTVSPGALLGGSGPIVGNLTNGGTVSPGVNGASSNNVSGNFVQTSAGNLIIQLVSATSFDRLAVSGPATLAGNVQVDTVNGYDPLGQSFTFLTAAGGVAGTFASRSGSAIASNRAAVAANLTYAPTSVTVSFAQLPFAGFAGTPNQIAVANAAQGSPALTAALNLIPQAGQFPAALNAMSPQPYQVWSNFGFASSTALADRVSRAGRTTAGNDDYYFEAGQSRGRARSDSDVGHSSYTTSTGLVGGNRPLGANSSAGAFFSYGKTTTGLGSPGSHTTLKDKTIGLRTGYAGGRLFAEAMLAYGFNRYESTRPVVFPGTAAVASSANRGHQWTTGFTVGQHLTHRRLTVSPFGGLLASRWKANAFTETGAGAFNASVAPQSAHSLRSQLGAEARLNLGVFQPHVRAAWLHEFSDNSRAMRASLDGVGFAVMTRRAPRNTMLYSAGLDVGLGERALLYTDVSAQNGGSTKVLSEWRVGLSVSY